MPLRTLERRIRPLALALVALAAPVAAAACEAPPPEHTLATEDLVARAETIVLARSVELLGETPEDPGRLWGRTMRFETVEVLKGEAGAEFTAPVGALAEDDHDFDGHRDPMFWDGVTLNANDTDCEIYPVYKIGATYLVFLDVQHRRGYEQIARSDDLWLGLVQALIDDPSRPGRLSMPLTETLGLYSGAHLATVEACDNPRLRVDETLRAPAVGAPEDLWVYDLPGGCAVGDRFLVLTRGAGENDAIGYGARALRLSGRVVDFGPIASNWGVEIELDEPEVSLEQLRTIFATLE